MDTEVTRSLRDIARTAPKAARKAYWRDTFGLDSEYGYDPVWAMPRLSTLR